MAIVPLIWGQIWQATLVPNSIVIPNENLHAEPVTRKYTKTKASYYIFLVPLRLFRIMLHETCVVRRIVSRGVNALLKYNPFINHRHFSMCVLPVLLY